jgi:curved DNA-binding protein CbpA
MKESNYLISLLNNKLLLLKKEQQDNSTRDMAFTTRIGKIEEGAESNLIINKKTVNRLQIQSINKTQSTNKENKNRPQLKPKDQTKRKLCQLRKISLD